MASPYIILDNNGTIISDTAEIKEGVQQEYQASLGNDLSLEDSTPQGRLIDLETEARTAVVENNVQIANSINFNLSSGIILDAWGANFDLYREPAVSSSVVATITGVAGTSISAGSQASTQAGDIFYLENNVVIPAGGSINTTFISLEKGPVACPVGSLTKIIDGTLGWETITNLAAATLGSLKESDESFKSKFYNEGLFSGTSLIEDYKNALSKVDNVISSYVIDNGKNTSETIDTVTLDAHSVYACVDGGTNLDVATALFNRKSGGCGWTAISGQSVVQNVVDPAYGDTYQVTFNRPDVVDFYCDISISAGTSTSIDLEADVQTAITNYINTHKIGEDGAILHVAQAVNSALPGIILNSITIGTVPGSLSTSNITIHINEVLKTQASNITVTIV